MQIGFFLGPRGGNPAMAFCGDFVQQLGPDMSVKIFMHLDDPSELARVCAVSRTWRQFVIANDLCKILCLRMFPEVSGVTHVVEADNMIEPLKVRSCTSLEWEQRTRNHKVYAFLARGLTTAVGKNCISEAISASSTDNYPEESVRNTLEPRDRVEHRASYWSSKGECDPKVSESLVYKLNAKLCIVTEIHIQPFQAYFQFGSPIYSAKAVRFRMGHLKTRKMDEETVDDSGDGDESVENKYVWTYKSPEFPMAQENCLQQFKLPQPVLSIGGILQVDLLGRVQRQEMDGLYYICVAHVQVLGRPLSPAFDVDIVDLSGRCTLKHYPGVESRASSASSIKDEDGTPSRVRTFTAMLMERGVRSWEQMILSTILGTAVVVDSDESDEEIPD
ncbi:F-box protein At4g00755-like isoform X1 [Syzygium oleosum]|uniref:F-box protein At4g00755-like isoform X1 n=2 Tax=Syzygium oleosum TaxID=219896 RepID=UPI0024BB842F|nr:F-box protein At4g00755-like isoform X1 [Syzygium oleosum]